MAAMLRLCRSARLARLLARPIDECADDRAAEVRGGCYQEVAPRRTPALLRHAHELSAREQLLDVRPAAERDAKPGDSRADQNDRVRELHTVRCLPHVQLRALEPGAPAHPRLLGMRVHVVEQRIGGDSLDRKSTRLNSSHSQISYAVFCLKKKK